MPLTTAPIKVNSREALTRAGADPSDFGITSPPCNFKVPFFNICCQQNRKTSQWTVNVNCYQMAEEGQNTSFYLGPGTYSSGVMLMGGSLTNYVEGKGNRKIYYEINDEIANLNRRAEKEHCDDIRHAYQITLKYVQDKIYEVIKKACKKQKYGKKQLAISTVRNEFIKIANHEKIKKIFRETISKNGYVDLGKFERSLSDLYLETANKTSERDSQGHHFFDVNREQESWSLQSWKGYLASENNKDFRTVIRGRSFRVPGIPTATLIVI